MAELRRRRGLQRWQQRIAQCSRCGAAYFRGTWRNARWCIVRNAWSRLSRALIISAPLPSATCCLGLQQLKVASSMCFCYVSFYPPPEFNISLALQQPMPAYCNSTGDLCSFCPSQLISSSAAQDNTASSVCGSALAPGDFMMSCTSPGSSQYSFPCHSCFCSCSSLWPSLQH